MNDMPQRIHDAAFYFYAATGKRPETLYLGHEEMRELKRFVFENMSINNGWFQERPTIDGMEIFEVDADNHLKVV